MKKKTKPTFEIVAVNVKKSVDTKEIYDCSKKDTTVKINDDINFNLVNLKHYTETAVLKIKTDNVKKKNLIYTVYMYYEDNVTAIFLSEADFTKYMTKKEFKELYRSFQINEAKEKKAEDEHRARWNRNDD